MDDRLNFLQREYSCKKTRYDRLKFIKNIVFNNHTKSEEDGRIIKNTKNLQLFIKTEKKEMKYSNRNDIFKKFYKLFPQLNFLPEVSNKKYV